MPEPSDQTIALQGLLDRMKAGDPSARAELVGRACERFRRLAQRGLRSFPLVHRWEETGDVLQNSMLRLHRALDAVTPGDVRQLMALGAAQIRRELIDLKRHYYGPEGLARHHMTRAPANRDQSQAPDRQEPAAETHDPAALMAWTEFHEHVERLGAEEREVFDLLWYQELTQEDAAALLGLSVKTVSRRWREARLHLGQALGGEPQ